MNHIKYAIEESASIYGKLHKIDVSQVVSQIKSKITSTISDRAIVNHAVIRKLEDYLGHSISELHCNVHPIDSLAIGFRKLCKDFEEEKSYKGTLFGKEA